MPASDGVVEALCQLTPAAERLLAALFGLAALDSYLRFRPAPRFDLQDPFVRRLVWQALRDVRPMPAAFDREYVKRIDAENTMHTINKLAPIIRQVVNDARQNKPSITIRPQDSKADVETAEVLSGLVRNIESSSNADIAYDTAVENAVSGGFGYMREAAIERMVRDARVEAIGGGATEVMLDEAAKRY